MKLFLKPFKEAQGGEKILLIASTIGLIVGILFLLWYFRNPLVSAVYPSKSKTHDVKTFKPSKVKIVQYGDKIKGKKDKDSKVVLHIFSASDRPSRDGPASPSAVQSSNEVKRYEIKVDEEGEWKFKIRDDLKENQKYLLVVQYFDQQNVLERVRSYKIKVVSNRKLYKQTKKFRKSLEKAKKKIATFITRKREDKKSVTSKGFITERDNLQEDAFSKLFFVELEYNVKSKVAKEIRIGVLQQNHPVLLTTAPASTPDKFIYKVEVQSKKGKLLENGWNFEYTDLKNKKSAEEIVFVVRTIYESGNSVKVSLPNGIYIWEGVIPRL